MDIPTVTFRGRKVNMADIRDVDESGNVIEKKEAKQEAQPQGVLEVSSDPLLVATEQVLGVETESGKARYSEKLRTILEWAKLQTEDQSPEGIKWAIRDLQMKIGSPKAGESHIDYLYSFVALSSQREEIDNKLKKYNHYGK